MKLRFLCKPTGNECIGVERIVRAVCVFVGREMTHKMFLKAISYDYNMTFRFIQIAWAIRSKFIDLYVAPRVIWSFTCSNAAVQHIHTTCCLFSFLRNWFNRKLPHFFLHEWNNQYVYEAVYGATISSSFSHLVFVVVVFFRCGIYSFSFYVHGKHEAAL